MKSITTFQLAISFVGVFLGAGFVSGQELWQFFGCFGAAGFFGFLLSTALVLLVDFALVQYARRQKTLNIGMLVQPGDHPMLRKFVDVMQCVLLFGILVIMTAGASSLLRDLTGIPDFVCGLVFVLAVAAAAVFELQGVVGAFSLLVPVTGIAAVIMGVAILFRNEFQLAPAVGSVAPLLPNWWVSGISYAAYNLFGSIGILVTIAARVPEKKTLGKGLGLGAAMLLLLTFCILAAMAAQPDSGSAELPTAALAAEIHPILAVGYNLLMGLGMFSAALSSLIALRNQGAFQWPALMSRRKLFLGTTLLAAYGLSLLGFGNLIGVVYPVFGYVSIPFLALLVRNWWKSRKTVDI